MTCDIRKSGGLKMARMEKDCNMDKVENRGRNDKKITVNSRIMV